MKVTVLQNGPYLIESSHATMKIENKEENIDGKMVALCRCGHSTNKPLCDGKHKQKGFEAEAMEMEIN